MDRICYIAGIVLLFGGLLQYDYRLAMVAGGVLCLALAFLFDFGIGNHSKGE